MYSRLLIPTRRSQESYSVTMGKADIGLAAALRADSGVNIPLTDREKDILRLVAEGLTNIEIAAQLYLSDKTVKSHVSNILAKLRLPDRTQAAVFAYRQGLTVAHHDIK